jgi:hypothetical protein
MPKLNNVSGTVLSFGRFKVLPGLAVPAVPYTDAESKAIDLCVRKGFLVPVPEPDQAPEQPEPAAEADQVSDQPAAEADQVSDQPAPKRRRKAEQ